MSDNQLDIDDLFHEEPDDDREPDDSKQQNVPKALREHAKRLKEENETLRKENKTLKDTSRGQLLDGFVESKGLDPVVKELIGDKDPEEWFQKYGSAFAAKTNEGDEGDGEGEQDEETTRGPRRELTPEQRQQLQETTSVQPGRSSARTGGPDLSELDSAKSFDEAMEMLRKQGLVAPNNSQT